MSADKPRRLGRGLEALLSTAQTAPAPATGDPSGLQKIPLAQIRPNPYQPRKEFRPEELADLEASLRTNGLLQPITVRPSPTGSGYELIAGERRYRAATRIGWAEIPAVVKDVDDRTLLILAMIENLQRADLNPLEEAEGYQRMVDEFGLTQQEVAEVIGKDRSTIANMLRVLSLPASVRRMLQEGQISLGHARALLALGSERAITDLAREIVAHDLSVREVERRAREATPAGKSRPAPSTKPELYTAEARRIEDHLRRHLQTDVQLSLAGKEKGTVKISFYSAEDLERLLELITGTAWEAQ